jgi:predicted component of type VI protein secretion system
MKIEISIDISPEEVRRLYGLPDLSTLHTDILAKLQQAVAKNDVGVLGNLVGPMASAGLKSIEDYNKLLWSLFNPNKKEEKEAE